MIGILTQLNILPPKESYGKGCPNNDPPYAIWHMVSFAYLISIILKMYVRSDRI